MKTAQTQFCKVRKCSGGIEDFDEKKLRASLLRSGASPAVADEIVKLVIWEISPATSTKKIYRLAKKHLNRLNHASGLRYSLKRALFRLGPTGYPFEKYVAELFRNYGYSAQVGLILEGECVRHEVDVLAGNAREIYAVECKYHDTMGRTTDVKVAMYVNSRVRDLELTVTREHPRKTYKGLLVTNTRCTSDAIQYSECAGLNVMGWRHPAQKSLERWIEDKRLYPVTIISGIQKGLINRLIQNHVVLLKDLMDMSLDDVMHILSLSERKARTLKRHAEELCGC